MKIEIITKVGFCPKGSKNVIHGGEQIEIGSSFQLYPSSYDSKMNGKWYTCHDLQMDKFANVTLVASSLKQIKLAGDCSETVLTPNEYKIIQATRSQKLTKLLASNPNWIAVPVAVLALVVSIGVLIFQIMAMQ